MFCSVEIFVIVFYFLQVGVAVMERQPVAEQYGYQPFHGPNLGELVRDKQQKQRRTSVN